MESSSNRNIAKNTMFLYGRMLLMMGINLFSSRIILQALGIEDYGLYNVIGSVVMMFSMVNGTLSAGTSRFIIFELGKGNIETLRKTFTAAFSMHLVLAIIVLILAETIGLWFVNYKMVIPSDRYFVANCLYQFSIVTCMLSLTQVPYNAIIIAHERLNIYAWVGISEAIFKLILISVIYYITFLDKLICYGLMLMCWNVLLQLYYRTYCKRKFEEATLTVVKDKSVYKRILSFSLWDSVGALCTVGNSQGVNIMMNLFFGTVVNAARGIAYQVENALTQFSSNFMVAVQPQIVKLYAKEKHEEFFKLIFESAKFSYFLLFLVSLPVFLEAEYILSIWLVEVPEYTVIFLRLIIICRLIRAINTPIMQGVHATGNIKWMNILSGGSNLLLQLPLTFLLYKMGRPPQSAFEIIIGLYIVANYMENISLKKNINFSIWMFTKNVYLKCILISLLSSIPSILITFMFQISFFRLLLSVLIGSLSIVMNVYYLVLSKETRNKIVLIIRNKMNKI